jgi:ketosteroid isomerase-like protein
MKLLAFLLALNVVLTNGARAQSKKAGGSNSAASTAEIRETLNQLYAAWSDLDPAKAAKFYAKDPDLTFFDVAPMKYTGWAEYAAGVPQAFAPYTSGKFTLNDDLAVHRRGTWAWATATWTGDLQKKDGGHENIAGRYTAILEKRGANWLIVHEHMSVPMK